MKLENLFEPSHILFYTGLFFVIIYVSHELNSFTCDILFSKRYVKVVLTIEDYVMIFLFFSK